MTDTADSPVAFRKQFDVSRETIERLEVYFFLLSKWNKKINLVSRESAKAIWLRHFEDSAQLWQLIPQDAVSWLDFGSGAGFPAMVNAIIALEKQPGLRFTMVDSDQRKMVFLSQVARETDVKIKIESQRISAISPISADVISARALAPLSELLKLSAKHSHKGTVLLFMKGQKYRMELTNAQKVWHISPEVIPSLTDSQAVILRYKGQISVS